MSGEAPLRQAVGRVIRPAPGKTQGIVVDCVDDHPFAQGAWKKRRAIYARNGWPISAYRSHTVSVPSWTQPVLALDLGTKAGWAVGWPRGRITSGSVDLGQSRFSGAGMRYLAFEKWLDETLNRVSPESVVWEEVRAHSGTEAAHVYGALMGILTATLERRGIPYRSVPVGTWKLGLTGRGNATKDEVMASVRDLGLSPSSQDEADAVGILIAGGSR
jgi:Holliday junction resolvasome RuvABC endonuclease subunit